MDDATKALILNDIANALIETMTELAGAAVDLMNIVDGELVVLLEDGTGFAVKIEEI